ncbi:hypothetical protein AYO47_03960 [Planctomyces sp. SCGC AG-212-M04]|nr:hypothetical protein AYO47_03960 [Planctomyces sp. SCGC AG-212-M04]
MTCNRQKPARRFFTRAVLLALATLIAIPGSAAPQRRFFRPAQSSIPSSSFAPAAPAPPSFQPSSPQVAPAEPTLADPPTVPRAPLTDAPRFSTPAVPNLKTPSLPLHPAAPATPVRPLPQALPTPAPQTLTPRTSPPQTVTSLRPDGSACFMIDVTTAYLNRLVSSPRQDAGPVSDTILGARVEGEQTTQSAVWIRTLPCSELARIDVNLGGQSCSRTTAVTPQAAIDIAGRQKFDLHKSVEFDGARFITRTPATQLDVCQQNLRARTGASQIPVVNSIAETIALNQADLRQPIARQEAARRVTNRVVPPFNQAIDERLAAANDWLTSLSSTAPNAHAFLISARWSSTEATVNGQLLAAVPVDTPAPPTRGGATVRMHESFGPSLSTALSLNGREISVDRIRGWIGVFGADVSGHSDGALPSLQAASNASLRLADDRPLAFLFRNNELRIVFRASIRAGDDVELPVHRVTVGYSIRPQGDSFELQPLPVSVEAEVKESMVSSAVEQVIRTQIESRLQPITITADVIPPTANGVRPRVSDVTSENGWLTVAFD